jgi:hypothetical protein
MNNKKWIKTTSLVLVVGVIFGCMSLNQSKQKNYLEMTQEEILNTPIDELATLPFNELMVISDKFTYTK